MIKPEILIWNREIRREVWAIENADFMDDLSLLDGGESYVDDWPENPTVSVDPEWQEWADQAQLKDQLPGSECFVVSEALWKFLQKEKVSGVEYFPIKINGLNGKLLSDKHGVINPLKVIDCIDTDASQVEWNQINSSLISACKSLMIQGDKVPADVKLFRPKHMESHFLIRYALAKSLIDAGFSHLSFFDPADFNGFAFTSGRPVLHTLDQ